jgi:hypothetical protein
MLDEGTTRRSRTLEAEAIRKAYVGQVLRLTLLAPEIVEAIFVGGSRRRCSWMIC